MTPEAMQPPAAFRVLLLATAGDGQRELVAGDLHEEFVYWCAQHGRWAGNRWYAGQVLRSLPQLLRLRIQSGELTHLVVAMACATVPLLLLDRLWRFVYSQILFKDGLHRAPGFLAANVLAVGVAAAMIGSMASTPRRAALLAVAAAAGAAIGLWASVSAVPLVYVCVMLLVAPAGSLAGFTKWRRK